MQLDKMSAQVRPRNRWEAIDLGVSMTRAWWRNVWKIWFAVTLPVFILLALVFHFISWYPELPDSYIEWIFWVFPCYPKFSVMIVMWWLKPTFDRFILLVISRQLFGEQMTVWKVLKLWPRYLLVYGWGDLTIFRFSPVRSMTQPVSTLEGLSGSDRRRRSSILTRHVSGAAFWLTLSMLLIEYLLGMAIMGGLYMLIPESLEALVMGYFENSDWLLVLILSFSFYLAMSIVEPFYVGGGFALYLNRRTLIEAWDIELSFRRLAERIKKVNMRSTAATVVLLMTIGLLCQFPQAAFADESVSEQRCREWTERLNEKHEDQAEQTIRKVLSEEEFEVCRQARKWQYIEKEDKESEEEGWLFRIINKFFKWLMDSDYEEKKKEGESSGIGVAQVIAALSEYLLWSIVIGLALWLVYQAIKHDFFSNFTWSKRHKKAPPPVQELFGLDLKRETLPKDIPAQAMDLCREGKYREALSLLYRGALSILLNRHRLSIPVSATEGDCQQIVKQTLHRRISDFFARLTRLWLRTAYAHRTPTADEIEAVCHEWKNVMETSHEE